MGFLKNLIRDAVDDGISKGIRDAVSSATEKIVAPKAEAYANKVASSIENATQAIDSASEVTVSEEDAAALEQAINDLSASAKEYAETAAQQADDGCGDWKADWAQKLPDFPLWSFGGNEFYIDENYTSDEGTTFYFFTAKGASYEDMCAYIEVLKADGFVQRYDDSDSVIYKDIGGEYLVFSSVEAFNDVDMMCVSMYRTKNENEI